MTSASQSYWNINHNLGQTNSIIDEFWKKFPRAEEIKHQMRKQPEGKKSLHIIYGMNYLLYGRQGFFVGKYFFLYIIALQVAFLCKKIYY